MMGELFFPPACQTNTQLHTLWPPPKKNHGQELKESSYSILVVLSVAVHGLKNWNSVQKTTEQCRSHCFRVTVQRHPDWVTVLPSDSKRPENCVGNKDTPPSDGVRSGPAGPGALAGALSHDGSCTAAVLHRPQ